MDEDSDSINWVLVDEIDCAEEALTLNPPTPTVTDSDQESDGSISIISDHPTDSYSEEEHELPVEIKKAVQETPMIVIDSDSQQLIEDEDNKIQVPEIESSDIVEKDHVEDVTLEALIFESNDANVSSTSSSSNHWAYAELNAAKNPFYLDCAQKPMLKNSYIETEVVPAVLDQECQTVVRKSEIPISSISNRDSGRDVNFHKIGIGLLISMMVLVGSHLIQQYFEYQDDKIQSPGENFLENFGDNEKARAIIDFCMDKQRSKNEYSEREVEKCVIKKLRKRNKEESMKKTEIYLQMKERILELREKELVEKEKEILRKWRKRSSSNEKKGSRGMEQRKWTEGNPKNYKEFENKFIKRPDFKGKKRRSEQEPEEKRDKRRNDFNSFNTKSHWDTKHKKDLPQNDKKYKKSYKIEKETLKTIKEKVKKSLQENTFKQNLKHNKPYSKKDSNEEWYIKYNPIKNTIELINITTLPEQDSLLIKNGNKTINGQWYFSLYGFSRTSIRNKEKAAEWYFKRGHFRENRRDKAKWYFDYMSARDNTRYMY